MLSKKLCFDSFIRSLPILALFALSSCNESRAPSKISNSSGKGDPQSLISDDKLAVTPKPVAPQEKTPALGLSLSSVTYQFRERKFVVDDYFNLSSTRSYQFVMQASNNSIVDGKTVEQGLKEGAIYKLKFRLNASNDPSANAISLAEVEWKVQQGKLQGGVEFSFQDLRTVQSRCLLQISIIENEKVFTYEGLFDPLNAGSVLLEAKDLKPNSDPKTNSPAFANDPIKSLANTLKAEPLPEKSGEEMIDAIGLFSTDRGIKQAAQQALCGLYYNGFWSYLRACKKAPETFLKLAYTDHLLKLKEAVADRVDSSNLTMTASLNFSEYESKDSSSGSSDSLSAKVDLGFGIPILKEIGLNLGIGVGYGKSWYWSESVTKGHSTSGSKGLSLSKSFVVEELHFNISGEMKSCLWIGARQDSENKKVYSVCGASADAKSEETYYYIYQPVSNGAIVDSAGDPADKPLVSLIRGKARFADFLQVAQNADFGFNLKKGLPSNSQLVQEFEGKYDGLYPGLLSEFKSSQGR